MTTQVVNIRNSPYDVYIGRGDGERGYFGNPFILGRDGDRETVVAKYKTFFALRMEQDPEFAKKIKQLKGKKLGCFCAPLACHGNVIANYLNFDDEASMNVGCIGSAGRGDTAALWTPRVYKAAYNKFLDLIEDVTSVHSGGAAWADHIVVSAVLSGEIPAEKVTLHLAARFLTSEAIAGYVEGDNKFNPGRILNYYHRKFSAKMDRTGQRTSLHGIAKAHSMGMKLLWEPYIGTPDPLKMRNLGIGRAATDLLIAFTWSDGDFPAPGGTKHCWDNASSNRKIHIRLRSLQ